MGIVQIFNKLVKDMGNPVDFELPESFNQGKSTSSFNQGKSTSSFNQGKSTSYSIIRRNVYLTKKVKKRVKDNDSSCSCSCISSNGSSGVCGRDCLCSMLYSCCSSSCSCGALCLNKSFSQRPAKKLKIVQTEKCGLGVAAEEKISQGNFVIEYVGEVIDDETCEERLWKMKRRGDTNFYLCEINKNTVIDATYKGNKSRYINHSCYPNTEMLKWTIDGETRIGIFATRDIEKGEHLTYDYQFVQFGADQDCHCGAAGCRKKLGITKPSKQEMPCSDSAALKIVMDQVLLAANSPKMKDDVASDAAVRANAVQGVGDPVRGPYLPTRNCNGSVIRILNVSDERCFGMIKGFDSTMMKHLIMFENGRSEFLDLSNHDWEFCTLVD